MSSENHRPSALGAAFFLLARRYFPWSRWPKSEKRILEAAGVSLEEAESAKLDVLDRIHDLIWDSSEFEDPEIQAMAAHAVAEVLDPDYEGFDPAAHALFLEYYASYKTLAQKIEEDQDENFPSSAGRSFNMQSISGCLHHPPSNSQRIQRSPRP